MGLYLGKQSIIAINEKVATKQWVSDQKYITNSSLADYVKKGELTDVSEKVGDISSNVADLSTNVIKKGTLGTINGKSIEDGNNISIDLTLYKVVDSLPTTEIDENKIYLLPNQDGKGQNVYVEYMYVKQKWEVVGEYQSEVKLDNYYTKTESDSKYLLKEDAGNLSDYIKSADLDTKVRESGYVKGSDVSTAIETKIDGFKKILLITTAEYNSLLSAGTTDNNTVYMTYDA